MANPPGSPLDPISNIHVSQDQQLLGVIKLSNGDCYKITLKQAAHLKGKFQDIDYENFDPKNLQKIFKAAQDFLNAHIAKTGQKDLGDYLIINFSHLQEEYREAGWTTRYIPIFWLPGKGVIKMPIPWNYNEGYGEVVTVQGLTYFENNDPTKIKTIGPESPELQDEHVQAFGKLLHKEIIDAKVTPHSKHNPKNKEEADKSKPGSNPTPEREPLEKTNEIQRLSVHQPVRLEANKSQYNSETMQKKLQELQRLNSSGSDPKPCKRLIDALSVSCSSIAMTYIDEYLNKARSPTSREELDKIIETGAKRHVSYMNQYPNKRENNLTAEEVNSTQLYSNSENITYEDDNNAPLSLYNTFDPNNLRTHLQTLQDIAKEQDAPIGIHLTAASGQGALGATYALVMEPSGRVVFFDSHGEKAKAQNQTPPAYSMHFPNLELASEFLQKKLAQRTHISMSTYVKKELNELP